MVMDLALNPVKRGYKIKIGNIHESCNMMLTSQFYPDPSEKIYEIFKICF